MQISRVRKESNLLRAEDFRRVTLSVCGYKSIKKEVEVELAPLTLLAGANSSGKSSMMQPLLILKQTFENLYDRGALLLGGANVHATSPSQILSKIGKEEDGFSIKLSFFDSEYGAKLFYKVEDGEFLRVDKADYFCGKLSPIELQHGVGLLPNRTRGVLFAVPESKDLHWKVDITNMGILALSLGMMHLPGLRGNPERVYPVGIIDKDFHHYVGKFDDYTASVINMWQEEKNEKLETLRENLKKLGLTGEVRTKSLNGAGVEINVSRTMSGEKNADMVNIADVGFGVSQVLPVLVALLAAEKDRVVYLEQPEIHLHPRAQYLLAKQIVDAANRGARVVVETHSSILLTGIQELGARGDISPDKVAFYWFSRDENGATKATRAELDENFAFGDWPEDFSDTSFNADMAYVDAVANKEEYA